MSPTEVMMGYLVGPFTVLPTTWSIHSPIVYCCEQLTVAFILIDEQGFLNRDLSKKDLSIHQLNIHELLI